MKIKTYFIREEKVLFEFLRAELKKIFNEGDCVFIKLHMGEPGNKTFIPASFTRQIVSILKGLGCKPTVFDSPVMYRSPRNNVKGYLKVAADHGYTKENVGAPIAISNESVPVKGKKMTYRIIKDLVDADGVLILSHVKGHQSSGMGGAIKNLGMGCVSKETKAAIHEGGEPAYTSGCVECGTCVENCPTENIVIKNGRPYFNATWCSGCSNCAIVCPEKCIRPKLDVFDEMLSEAASIAFKHFKKSYSVNFLKYITQMCDCMSNPGPIIADDIGFVCSANPLSADIASMKIIEEETGRKDIFADANKKSSYEQIERGKEYFGEGRDISIERHD